MFRKPWTFWLSSWSWKTSPLQSERGWRGVWRLEYWMTIAKNVTITNFAKKTPLSWCDSSHAITSSPVFLYDEGTISQQNSILLHKHVDDHETWTVSTPCWTWTFPWTKPWFRHSQIGRIRSLYFSLTWSRIRIVMGAFSGCSPASSPDMLIVINGNRQDKQQSFNDKGETRSWGVAPAVGPMNVQNPYFKNRKEIPRMVLSIKNPDLS